MRLKTSPATGTEGRSRTKRPRISRARAGSLDAKDIASPRRWLYPVGKSALVVTLSQSASSPALGLPDTTASNPVRYASRARRIRAQRFPSSLAAIAHGGRSRATFPSHSSHPAREPSRASPMPRAAVHKTMGRSSVLGSTVPWTRLVAGPAQQPHSCHPSVSPLRRNASRSGSVPTRPPQSRGVIRPAPCTNPTTGVSSVVQRSNQASDPGNTFTHAAATDARERASNWNHGSHWHATPPSANRDRIARKCSSVYSHAAPSRSGWNRSDTITSYVGPGARTNRRASAVTTRNPGPSVFSGANSPSTRTTSGTSSTPSAFKPGCAPAAAKLIPVPNPRNNAVFGPGCSSNGRCA